MSSTQGGIISLNFGGCGVRLGASTTRLYAEDFGIGMDGSIASNRMREGYYYDVFFSEQKGSSDQDNKKFLSRSLYFDSDPDSLDSLTGPSDILAPATSKLLWTTIDRQESQAERKEYFIENFRRVLEMTDFLQGLVMRGCASGTTTSAIFCEIMPAILETAGAKYYTLQSTLLDDLHSDQEWANSLKYMSLSADQNGIDMVWSNTGIRNLLRENFVPDFNYSFSRINELMSLVEGFFTRSLRTDTRSDVNTLAKLTDWLVPYPTINLIEARAAFLSPKLTGMPQDSESSLVEKISEEAILLSSCTLANVSHQAKVNQQVISGYCVSSIDYGKSQGGFPNAYWNTQLIQQKLKPNFPLVEWVSARIKVDRFTWTTTERQQTEFLDGLPNSFMVMFTNSSCGEDLIGGMIKYADSKRYDAENMFKDLKLERPEDVQHLEQCYERMNMLKGDYHSTVPELVEAEEFDGDFEQDF